MTQTKKLVYGTRKGYDREMARRKADGWQVVSEEVRPRGLMNKKMVYIATLNRHTNDT